MQPFAYQRAADVPQAIALLAAEPEAAFIAGGTELVNWLKEGIVQPRALIDINGLRSLAAIEAGPGGLRIGALARMSEVAAHPVVRRAYPAVAEALVRSASQQLRNMASMGGNLLQRTRCPYFRADVPVPCNKRTPGSGCSALHGHDRHAAIFGWSESCIATHPSDVAVVLAALDAVVHVRGAEGERKIALEDFYRLPGDRPQDDTTLRRGELITAIEVPAAPFAARSRYLKVRERTSYEFALVSAAVALDLDGSSIRAARIALGGVAPKPWRLRTAEAALAGRPFTVATVRAALDGGAFAGARPRHANAFKVELAKRTIVRALTGLGAAA
jgi:xanthine dehydrogenase YagS FAD-binding subunit